MKQTLIGSLIAVLLSLPAMAQTKKTEAARPEIGKYCKVYRAGEGLKVLILRVGPEANNESLVCTDGFDHPWDGKIFKAKVVKADGRQEFTIQNNGRPFVVLVFREKYGQSLLYVPNTGPKKPNGPFRIQKTSRPTAIPTFCCRST